MGFNSMVKNQQIRKHLLVATTLTLVGVFYLLVLAPTFHLHISCPFLTVTGYYCPGCGLTRLCIALLHGEVYQAFRYNPIIFFIVHYLITVYILNIRNEEKVRKVTDQANLVVLIIVILYGVLRNTQTFAFLAPTVINP